MFSTFIVLGVLYWKRHNHPLNLILLSVFTLLEAFTIGIVTAFYPNKVVLQALSVILVSVLCIDADVAGRLITLAIFTGLTLFTFQSKVGFSG
jgi:FtsH-binding integral membrane protein